MGPEWVPEGLGDAAGKQGAAWPCKSSWLHEEPGFLTRCLGSW